MGYKQYCKNYQDIENYEKAKKDGFKGWECHHRLETHTPDGERRDADISHNELKALRMYYNRPASELIFLTESEHASLHQKGKPKSEETKKKMSEAQKGRFVSEETRNKISETLKGKLVGDKNPFYGKKHLDETRKKISEANKGRHWFNNGKISIMRFECPDGFVPGRIPRKK